MNYTILSCPPSWGSGAFKSWMKNPHMHVIPILKKITRLAKKGLCVRNYSYSIILTHHPCTIKTRKVTDPFGFLLQPPEKASF